MALVLAEEPRDEATARLMTRITDLAAVTVATEQAAAAMATERGWEWPSLAGYAVAPGVNLELARLEMRQQLRRLAHVAVTAFRRHLEDGGHYRPHELAAVGLIYEQNAMDAERRRALKPRSTRLALVPSEEGR